jgi:hypothetical protein
MPFKPAFPPSHYGWDDALRLNSLQYVLENGYSPFAAIGSNQRVYSQPGPVNWRVFSAAEADFLTLSYLHHPQRMLDLIRQSLFLAQDQDQADMLFTLLELFTPGMVDAPSMHWITPLDRAMRRSIHALFCDFDTRSAALNLITTEIAALRLRLYHRPRAVAFRSAVSVLSDDVCRLILRFAEVVV